MAPSMKTRIRRRQQLELQRRQQFNVMMELSSMSSSPTETTKDDNPGNTTTQMVETVTKEETAFVTTNNDKRSEKDLKILLQEWMGHAHADYHSFTRQEATEIRSALLQWYTTHRRKLPWRGDPPPFDGSTSGRNTKNKTKNNQNKKTGMNDENFTQPSIQSFFSVLKENSTTMVDKEDKATNADSVVVEDAIPVTGYGVWVSEIMLQQTRVEAVIPYWIRWMKSFPTIHDLAKATEDEVNAHWAGLGFYRRARFLHQGAKFVVEKFNGELPTTPEELSKLPGVGPYTAAAISSIAYNVCVPVVDGNVCRVLSRLTGIANHIKHPLFKDKLGWNLAGEIVKAGDGAHPGLINQALMELGATFCAPAGSGIDDRDPLKAYYMSTKIGRAILSTKRDKSNKDDVVKLMDSLMYMPSTDEECCRLCDRDGVVTVLRQLQESITESTSVDDASKVGHSVFPMDPPKSDKREEDLAMAVLSLYDNNSSTERYLMVKRPSTGLLAGQWEFPNVCVQSRNSKEQTKTISATKPSTKASSRQRALTNYLLDDLFRNYSNATITAAISQTSRDVNDQPLEHIFSHVRHLMWLETVHLQVSLEPDSLREWTSSSGRQVRWMSSADMEKVGITSGVKKVLKAVQDSTEAQAVHTRKRKS